MQLFTFLNVAARQDGCRSWSHDSSQSGYPLTKPITTNAEGMDEFRHRMKAED